MDGKNFYGWTNVRFFLSLFLSGELEIFLSESMLTRGRSTSGISNAKVEGSEIKLGAIAKKSKKKDNEALIRYVRDAYREAVADRGDDSCKSIVLENKLVSEIKKAVHDESTKREERRSKKLSELLEEAKKYATSCTICMEPTCISSYNSLGLDGCRHWKEVCAECACKRAYIAMGKPDFDGTFFDDGTKVMSRMKGFGFCEAGIVVYSCAVCKQITKKFLSASTSCREDTITARLFGRVWESTVIDRDQQSENSHLRESSYPDVSALEEQEDDEVRYSPASPVNPIFYVDSDHESDEEWTP